VGEHATSDAVQAKLTAQQATIATDQTPQTAAGQAQNPALQTLVAAAQAAMIPSA
jgi:hypothetical protein